MRAGKNGRSQGYTIIEVMIFLAVSGGLLASALLALSGSKARAEFSYGVQEFAAQLTDVANDVSTGYYLNPGVSCSIGTDDRPKFASASDSVQGTNADCVFVGRVIQFGNGSNKEVYVTHSVVGRRLKSGGAYVSSLAESKPVSLLNATVDGTNEIRMPGGLTVEWAKTDSSNATAIGYFSDFLVNSPVAGNLKSGANNVDVVTIAGTVNNNKQEVANKIKDVNDSSVNPTGGVRICVKSSGTDQHAILTVGGSGSRFNPDVQIDSGNCP